MSRTDRTIQISAQHYEKVRRWCEVHGLSVSDFVEAQVHHFLGPEDPFESLDPDPSLTRALRLAGPKTHGWN